MAKRIAKETKRNIIEYVEAGGIRAEASKKFGVSAPFVYNLTAGMAYGRGNTALRGETLEILKALMKDGYYLPDSRYALARSCYKALKKHFPVKVVMTRKKSVYFCEGKEKEAMKAFLGRWRKGTMSFRELGQMSKLFGISLKSSERESMLSGKFRMEKYAHKFKILKKVKKIPRQAAVSDFIGRFLHSELLWLAKTL